MPMGTAIAVANANVASCGLSPWEGGEGWAGGVQGPRAEWPGWAGWGQGPGAGVPPNPKMLMRT